MGRAMRTGRGSIGLGLLLFLVACGTGGAEQGAPAFELLPIGPAGGSIAAGDVLLTIPPGALASDLLVTIIAQPDPLPIQPEVGDTCLYDYLGPIWCVGPVGHGLLTPAQLVLQYDPTTIPVGLTEDDLVLLLWDNANQVMVPVVAVQDQAANKFTFDFYGELGHVAVGVRTCPDIPQMALWVGAFGNPFAQGFQVLPAPPGIYVGDGDATGVVPTLILDSSATSSPPSFTLGSVDGQQVLFGGFDDSENFSMGRVPTIGGPAMAIEPTNQNIYRDYFTIGWWAGTGGSLDVFFHQFPDFAQDGLFLPLVDDPSRDGVQTRFVSAFNADPSTLYHATYSTNFPWDMRQSPTGAHTLHVYEDFGQGMFIERLIEIVDTQDGSLLSDTIPFGAGLFSPRFQADGQSVYLVSGEVDTHVEFYALDGTFETAVEIVDDSLSADLLDFVFNPAETQFAALVHVFNDDESEQFEIWLGTWNGSDATVVERFDLTNAPNILNGTPFFEELVWNPVAPVAYLSLGFDGTVPFAMDPGAPPGLRIVPSETIPVTTIGNIDASRLDGRLLVTSFGPVFDKPSEGGSSALYEDIGVWIADALGESPVLTAPPVGVQIFEEARWLLSWRRAISEYSGVR